MTEEYLYCTIPYIGRNWTFTKKAVVTETSTTTGRHSGYGDILDPSHSKHKLALTVPIIDLRDNWDATKAAITCPDSTRPKDEYPQFNSGTLSTYLEHIEKHGGKVIYPDGYSPS